jgi:hypothetical protein
MRRLVAVVVAACVVGAAAMVVVLGSSTGQRSAGSNRIEAAAFDVVVPDGQEYCQRHQLVPKDANRVKVTLGSYDASPPPVAMSVRRADGSVVLHTVAPSGYRQGVVALPLGGTTREPLRDASVCFSPRGTKIALAGFANEVRLDFVRPGNESWFDVAPAMVHRFGLGKPAWQGPWTAFLAILLLLAVWVLTARLILREART